MKVSPLVLLLLLASIAAGQPDLSNNTNVLTSGVGNVGRRSGKDVDMKYYVNGTGVYDTGLTPYQVTQEGTLVRPGGLKGVEVGLGAYGRHAFRKSAIGVDYNGNFRHYANGSSYDGSNQLLRLEHVYQPSRKLLIQSSANAGTQSFGTAISAFAGLDSIVDSTTLLFDNRTSYIQTGLTTRYALSNRTTVSMGGNFYSVHRQSSALVGVRGYALQGALNRQLSRRTIIGVNYQHLHFDFPRAFGESDINSYMGTLSKDIGRYWNISVSGGVFHSQVQGVESTALDPVIAALLGISSVRTIFYRSNLLPMGSMSVTRQFRRASISGTYSRLVTPGNGIFLTSRQTSASGSYSYTGVRRMSFSVMAGRMDMTSLGQTLQPFNQLIGSANWSYNMARGMNLVLGYARRHQDVQSTFFPRDSSRISIGIFFSPGEIPVSLH